MKILFIGPMPPPITGHSVVSKALYDDLVSEHDVRLVNIRKNSSKEGVSGFKRIVEVAGFLIEVWFKKNDADTVYLTISESFAGNVKDLCIYLLCFRQLSSMYIHLHGGTIKRCLWDHHPKLRIINKYFLKRLGGVIISGRSHETIFEDAVSEEKIHIVPNFAEEYLFLDEQSVIDNFSDTKPLKILYMSSMREKKGYNDLADAFFLLNDDVRERVQIDFCGSFGCEKEEQLFLQKIANAKQIHFHGMVDGEKKKSLFTNAHVFCLPTSYFEGQPISILEAYATGCVVLTTGQSGIRDIFEDTVNGFEIEQMSPSSISSIILDIVDKSDQLKQIALENRAIAEKKYRVATYNSSLRNILEEQMSELSIS